MSGLIIVPITVNDEVLHAIVTDHRYYPDSESVELLAGYMAEPGKDFHRLMKSKELRAAVKAGVVNWYDSI